MSDRTVAMQSESVKPLQQHRGRCTTVRCCSCSCHCSVQKSCKMFRSKARAESMLRMARFYQGGASCKRPLPAAAAKLGVQAPAQLAARHACASRRSYHRYCAPRWAAEYCLHLPVYPLGLVALFCLLCVHTGAAPRCSEFADMTPAMVRCKTNLPCDRFVASAGIAAELAHFGLPLPLPHVGLQRPY